MSDRINLRRLVLAAGTVAAALMGSVALMQSASAAPAASYTQVLHGSDQLDPDFGGNPCTGDPLSGSQDENLVNHVTVKGDELWATFTEEAWVNLIDTAPGGAQITYTGHYSARGNVNLNEKNQTSTFTFSAKFAGSDGSTLTGHDVTQFGAAARRHSGGQLRQGVAELRDGGVMSTAITLPRPAARIGVAVAIAASGLTVYAAYGDSHAGSSQRSAVPVLVGIVLVVAAAVFGLLVPRLLNAIRNVSPRAARGATVCGVAAFVSMVAFWSGVPLVLGAAAALLGADGRRAVRASGMASRPYTATLILGVIAVVGSVAMTVLGNTVLAR